MIVDETGGLLTDATASVPGDADGGPAEPGARSVWGWRVVAWSVVLLVLSVAALVFGTPSRPVPQDSWGLDAAAAAQAPPPVSVDASLEPPDGEVLETGYLPSEQVRRQVTAAADAMGDAATAIERLRPLVRAVQSANVDPRVSGGNLADGLLDAWGELYTARRAFSLAETLADEELARSGATGFAVEWVNIQGPSIQLFGQLEDVLGGYVRAAQLLGVDVPLPDSVGARREPVSEETWAASSPAPTWSPVAVPVP